jgi:hypothetical protein
MTSAQHQGTGEFPEICLLHSNICWNPADNADNADNAKIRLLAALCSKDVSRVYMEIWMMKLNTRASS